LKERLLGKISILFFLNQKIEIGFMVENTAREINCVLCKDTYTPILGPGEGEKSYRIYCSSCVNWVAVGRTNPLRLALRIVLGLRDEALSLAIQTCLSQCSCGSNFSCDSGGRCQTCIDKIERETKSPTSANKDFTSPWNNDEMKKLQPKFLEHILGGEEDTENIKLKQLIEKFEAGKMGAEEYMEAVESLQFRESNQVSVVQAWAMTMDPEELFAAVEDYDLVERYGSRIIVSIASALESSIGRPVLTTLNNEMDQFDQVTQQELKTFMRKIGGGF